MVEEIIKKKLLNLLAKLKTEGEIDGSAIITRDGLMIISDLHDGLNEEIFGAMSAALIGAAETAMSELKKDYSLSLVISEFGEGKLVTVGAGSNTILVSMVRADANIGLVLIEMKKTAKNIEEIVGT